MFYLNTAQIKVKFVSLYMPAYGRLAEAFSWPPAPEEFTVCVLLWAFVLILFFGRFSFPNHKFSCRLIKLPGALGEVNLGLVAAKDSFESTPYLI